MSSWTREQENRYQEWLTWELMKTFHLRKTRAQYQAGMFLLFYGWTLKDEPQESIKQLSKRLQRGERGVGRENTVSHEAAKRKMRKCQK